MLKITSTKRTLLLTAVIIWGFQAHSQIIDKDFGDDGMTTTVFTPEGASVARAIGVQGNDKLVAVGYDNGQMGGAFAASRYLADGTLDTSFGTNGKVVLNVGGLLSDAYEVAFDNSGNIFIAGIAEVDATAGGGLVDVLVKMTPAGVLDNTFGTNGVVMTKFGSEIQSLSTSVLVQDNGKIILGGSVNTGSSSGSASDFAVARINSDGSIDESFGDAGFKIVDMGAYDTLFKLAFTSDEKIVAVGYAIADYKLDTESSDAVLTQINTDGSIDESFGSSGIATLDLNAFSYAYNVAVQNNNKIVITGETKDNGTLSDFFTARYNTDGTLDNTFNDTGIVQTNFLTEENIEESYSVSIQQNERIVVAGAAGSEGTRFIAIARLMPNGKYDDSFGEAGKYLYETDATRSINILGGELLAENKLVLAGRSQVNGKRAFFLSQFSLDETLSVEDDNLVSMSVYPNPTRDVINFQSAIDMTTSFVSVYDASGRIIKNEALTNSRKLDISDLASGAYLVQVSNGKQVFTKKIMKR
ncbi:MAG: T9SS type A sorting domain-containing protein [Leeuwenhoekiella sp.]